MKLQVQLAGCVLLLLAAFEIGCFLVTSIFALFVKAGVFKNISINSHTKISVTAARIQISLWKHLWQFLRASKQKNLVVLTLPFVHILVVKRNTDSTPRSHKVFASPQLWQTLDTCVSLKDIRHPCWSAVRVWFPRLVFLVRWCHLIRLNVHSLSLDVEEYDDNTLTPIFSIQHGRIDMYAAFQTKTNEVLCKVTMSRAESMKVVLHELNGTAALGRTDFSVRLPFYCNFDDLRAPIPTAYLVTINLIEMSLDLERTLQTALQQESSRAVPIASSESNLTSSIVDDCCIRRVLTLLQFAEITPDDLHCEIRKLKVNIVDRVLPYRPNSLCTLELCNFCAKVMDNPISSERFQRKPSSDYPLVTRRAYLKLASLGLCFNDIDDVNIAPPLLKLDGVKLSIEGILSANRTRGRSLHEREKSDGKQHHLYFQSLISGSSRNLNIVFLKNLEPWILSCCTVYDATVQQDRPLSHEIEYKQVEVLPVAKYCEFELDAHFKVPKTIITLLSLDRTCDVLSKGVPSIQLVLGEINVYSQSCGIEENLGVRANVDIQCSHLQAYYLKSDMVDLCSFLSIDFVRVFLFPVDKVMQSNAHAEVEMEIEWVEVKWAPDVLHAIGGVMELGLFTLASFLHESRHVALDTKVTNFNGESKTRTCVEVAPMRSMADVAQDKISSGEALVFRCVAKQICVMFPYMYCEQRRLDYVTVDTFTVSSEKTSKRLRISLLNAKAFPSQRLSEELLAKPASFEQVGFRRKGFTSRVSRSRTGKESMLSGLTAPVQKAVFFAADCFSIEENQVPGSTKTVVDLFVSGVWLEWDLATHLRIMELTRQITFAAWEMIYLARKTYAIYCTPSDSIYHRVHGLNPPLNDLDECLRYESQFADLISASGDKLHRLHATNVSIHAKPWNQVDVHLTVGVFAGDDLPEVWLFQNISVKVDAFEILSVACIHVRHTLNRDNQYVFGVFEDMLRKRLSACRRSTSVLDQTMVDGMLVNVDKLQLHLSQDFPLQACIDAVQSTFDPFKEQISSALSSHWRPQQEIFYRFFLQTPVAFHQPEVWLRLQDTSLECLGSPFESWLERMYPMWIEELAMQELRAHVLDDHIAKLKISDADKISDASYNEMNATLTEKNAGAYIWKAKKVAHKARDESTGPLFHVSVGHVDFDVSFDKDIAASWVSIKQLDEATKELETAFESAGRDFAHYTLSCRFSMGLHVKTKITDLAVNMRRFPTPLLTCTGLQVGGDVFLIVCNRGNIDLGLMRTIRSFFDLSVEVTCPVVFSNPGYQFALNELLRSASNILALVPLDIDHSVQMPLLDTARRLLHGKVCVTVNNASVRLFSTTTSFECADFLEMRVHRARFAYSSGLVDIEVTRVAVKIEPKSFSDIAELSHLTLQVWFKWDALTSLDMHYLYPIEFVKIDKISALDERFVLDSPKPADWCCEEANPTYQHQVDHATKLSIYIKGKVCPAEPEMCDLNEGWSQRDIAARTAIVLYTQSVEWLIKFGRVYQMSLQHPLLQFRNRSLKQSDLIIKDFFSILEGVTVEEFDLIGLDVALYASEKHLVGVRAVLDDRISCSGALLKKSHVNLRNTEDTEPDGCDSNAISTVRQLSFLFEEKTWILQNVNVDARCVQLRVCTSEAGSRGEPLVSLQHTSLIVGGGTEQMPMHDDSLMKARSLALVKRSNTIPSLELPSEGGTKERAGQSILEFFDIPNENPFSYRESDSEAEDELDDTSSAEVMKKHGKENENKVLDDFPCAGFLLGLLSKNIRVTLTMVALESLVDIADTWVHVIKTTLPELFFDVAATTTLLERNEHPMDECKSVPEKFNLSPKKFTSLAQDPKFSGLCLQGGADTPVNKTFQFEPTPYSNADTKRPTQIKSRSIVSQLGQDQSQEDRTLCQPEKLEVAQAFLMIKLEDCQISIQNQLHKGSVLLALNSGTLQHAVSQDSQHERFDLNVDGLQVFTAPLDVDVKSHATWLKVQADGSYCPTTYGLLRQVVAPIPALVTVWIDHKSSLVKNKIVLDIPAIEVHVNLVTKEILAKLTTTAMELVNVKLAEKKDQAHIARFQGYLREVRRQKHSLYKLFAIKRQLKWQITALNWRQQCGWNCHLSKSAISGTSAFESARYFVFNIVKSKSTANDASNVCLLGRATLGRYEDERLTDEMYELTQQYEALSDLTRLMVQESQKQFESSFLPNVHLDFTLDRASLTLCGENVDIIRAQMSSLSLQMQLLEDHSGKFALNLQNLSINNLSPATPYPDLLLPIYSRSWAGDEVFLRIDAELAKPIQKTTVVQHFEVNVHPIQVCITQEVILQLITFFSPGDSNDNTREVKREEVRSQFLQARSSSASDGRVGSAIFKAVKVAGKAAAHPLSLGRPNRGDSVEQPVSSSFKEKVETLDFVHEDSSQWLAKLVSSSLSNELLLSTSDDVDSEPTNQEMVKDCTTNSILFKRIRLGAVEVVLTYKNKRSNIVNHASLPQALEDVRGFEVKTRALVYCDKTCSPLDLLLRIRRDIVLDVLSQVGRNFTNIGNFLRDQFDLSRWAAFDGLAPLKSLSTTVSSFTAMGLAHSGVVVPYSNFPELFVPDFENKDRDSNEVLISSTSTSFKTTELPYVRRGSDLSTDHQDADNLTVSTPTLIDGAHRKPTKVKQTLTKLFNRKKSSLQPAPSTSS